jgi:glycosyltransferase involved in cell wall biosynthesis
MNDVDVLVDLKPALDGYAGIPQETRLLFAALHRLETVKVQGLIQHGGRRLRAGLSGRSGRWTESKRIFQLSKLIVSLTEMPHDNIWAAWADKVGRYFALTTLQIKTALGLSIPCTTFESKLFGDFIWRTFFDKTLSPADKKGVTAAVYRVAQPSRNHLHKVGLKSLGMRRFAKFPTLDTTGIDFFVAQNPFPGRIGNRTQLVIRYHDAVPILMPHTITDKAFHQATHFHALQSNVRSGAWFSCISKATQKDLLTLFPEAEARSFVIHDMVSEEYFEDASPKSLVARIVRNRVADIPQVRPTSIKKPTGADFQYLLMVSTLEPRKNHMLMVSAWEKLKYGSFPALKLIVVGGLGWDQDTILKAFKPWIEQGELYYLHNVPSPELRVLYQHAAATVCPSLAEGFDYSGVEAMRCGCPVVASDIPVHREVYQDAAVYFDPYSIAEGAQKISEVIGAEASGLRVDLVEKGRTVSAQYLPAQILPEWRRFFEQARRQSTHDRLLTTPGLINE